MIQIIFDIIIFGIIIWIIAAIAVKAFEYIETIEND